MCGYWVLRFWHINTVMVNYHSAKFGLDRRLSSHAFSLLVSREQPLSTDMHTIGLKMRAFFIGMGRLTLMLPAPYRYGVGFHHQINCPDIHSTIDEVLTYL